MPLVQRTTAALAEWLGPAYSGTLTLRANLDNIPALTAEQDTLWSRLDKATFLTDNEKRAAVGYGPVPAANAAKLFNPAQPRDHIGRWTPADGAEVTPVAGKKVGGIPKAVLDWTVRKFVSSYCKGSIRSELPGQFEEMSIADVIALAKGGDAAAKTCYKLLNQPRFRK